MRTHEFWENPLLQPVIQLLYGHTMPIAPFPTVEHCMGLNPRDSHMAIKEGYAVMAFDYKVLPSSKRCLFEMVDSKLKKEAARLEKYH